MYDSNRSHLNKPKTFALLEGLVGENGDGSELFGHTPSEASDYFDNKLKQYLESVYYKAGKAMALIRLGLEKDSIRYFDSIIDAFDKYLANYWPSAAELFDITLDSLYRKAWVLNKVGIENEGIQCLDKAMNSIDSLMELSSKNPYAGFPNRVWLYKARVYAVLQNEDKALEYLGKAIRIHESTYSGLMSRFKENILELFEFQSLKSDKQFQTLLDKPTIQ